jgi:hypothetical protein
MNAASIAYRYSLLLREIERRMAIKCKWSGLPGLLDELHALRCQYQATRASAHSDPREARRAETCAAVQ